MCKCLLAKKFVFVLNNFLNMHTPRFNRHKVPLDYSEEADLQILQNLKKSSYWLPEYQ